jgi:hypothetical protein
MLRTYSNTQINKKRNEDVYPIGLNRPISGFEGFTGVFMMSYFTGLLSLNCSDRIIFPTHSVRQPF